MARNYTQQIIKIDTIRSEIEEARDALQEKFDALSENAQEGAVGEKLQVNIGYLDEAIDHLEGASDTLGAVE